MSENVEDWTWRIVVLDRGDVEIEKTWETWGLQGSGSQHYRVDGAIVPTERTYSLYEPRIEGPLNRPHDAILRKMAGIPVGVAVGALQIAAQGVERKVRALGAAGEKPNDRVLATVGRLAVDLLSLRAAVYSSVATEWELCEQRSVDQDALSTALVATAVIRQRAFEGARALVLKAGDLLGAQAVYVAAGDLGARLADLNVICQHAVGQQSLLDMAGNRILGGEASGPFL